MIPRLATLAAAAVLAAVPLLAVGAPPAQASCIGGGPTRSAHAFTGRVLEVSSGGRVAKVRTDAGKTVEVRGTPDLHSAATSVDRTYQVGGRYEFHPINAGPPWEDNTCTATRLLDMSETAAGPSTQDAGGMSSRGVTLTTGIALAAAAGVAATLAGRRRRRMG